MSNKTIQHKRSSVAGRVPSTAQVAIGEIAINFADKSIYTQDGGGNIIELERDIFKSAAAPASPSEGEVWYDTTNDFMKVWDGTYWIPIIYNGPLVTPGNTSFANTAPTGSGTTGAPYVISATVNSGEVSLIDTVTVTGLQPGQVVQVVDTNAAANGGRFSWTGNVADSAGTMTLNVYCRDLPASANGTVYTANLVVGSASTYIDVTATIAAVVAFPQTVSAPTGTNPATTSWTAANDTLTASDCYEISTDGVTYVSSPATLNVTTGDTLYVKWKGTAGSGTCIDSPDGTTINGTITASDGSSQTDSLTIDKAPAAFTFTDATGVALSTVTQSDTITISGINSYSYLTSADTMEVSINGGAWVTVPASGTTVFVENGDTVQVRHTSSSTATTQLDTTLDIGGVTDTFSSTTGAAASVTTPTITAPTSGATDVGVGVTFTSSTYAVSGAVGTHQQSDWEIFDAAGYNGGLFDGTPVASSYNDTTNLESWTPGGLAYSTQYYVRVKHRSNDPIESAWSTAVSFTTGVQLGASFTAGVSSLAETIVDVMWDGTKYIAVGERGYLITSTDGSNWTTQTVPVSDNITSIVYTGSLYVAETDNDEVITSTDGITWTQQPNNAVNQLIWDGAQLVGVNNSNDIKVSTDGGVSWTTVGINVTTNVLTGVYYDSTTSLYIAIDDKGNIFSSTDVVTWTQRHTAPVGKELIEVTSNGSIIVATGRDGANPYIMTSTDGITWTQQTNPAGAADFHDVIWDGSQFVGVDGGGGNVVTSPDGITWTATAIAADTFRSVATNGSQHVYIGSKPSALYTSP